MHLMEILSARQMPAAGLYMSLTRRCPLSCAHCSTNSTLSSEEYGAEVFLRLVESFTEANRPDMLVLTGGEPLLRPRLVRDLTERAHAVGTRVVLASGMFFARQPQVPPGIDAAIAAVDHFTASLDVFHEQEVPRASVFAVFQKLLDRGQDLSLLVVGLDEEDPYLRDITRDIRKVFSDQVPVLVGLVGAVGRAAQWMEARPQAKTPPEIEPLPCDMASWPVVGYDGTVVACCNQGVVDGPAPAHLRIGHAGGDDWETIRQRSLNSALLRAVRIYGPRYVADRFGSGAISCDGYCSTCSRLSDDDAILRELEPVMLRPAMAAMEEQVAMLQQEVFLTRHGPPAYADLAWLGSPDRPGVAAMARPGQPLAPT